jgi:Ca2+/Na+ antiporter
MKKFIGIILLLASSVASAQDTTVATIADSVVDQITQFPDVFGAASYVLGIVIGIKALFKFKEHNETKGQQVKLSVPLVMIAASALFLGLPTVLKMGVDTFGYNQIQGAQFKYNYSKEQY